MYPLLGLILLSIRSQLLQIQASELCESKDFPSMWIIVVEYRTHHEQLEHRDSSPMDVIQFGVNYHLFGHGH